MPDFDELSSLFGYSILSCLAFEYFWAKCATTLGPIEATIGSTAFFIPVSLALDFLIWPKPGTELSRMYLVGILLVILSFLIVSLAADPPIHEEVANKFRGRPTRASFIQY